MTVDRKAEPALEPAPVIKYELGGLIRERLKALTQQWLLVAPGSNPAMLEMFRDRDRKPPRNMVPWAGEFAGKYLTHAVQICRLTGDSALEHHLRWFVNELVSLQDRDGYLGPWPKDCRLTGRAPNTGKADGELHPTWDAWGHYHIMLGLLLWHRLTRDRKALLCVRRIGDLICSTFLKTGRRLVEIGSEEMNLAPIHSLCLLYEQVGEPLYLKMAREIEKDFETPPAGDYIRTALKGVDFYQTPKPRWESLHPIQGIAELYFTTGDERYRRAFEQIWWSILRTDRHNTGGFSSGEKAQGDPYHQGPIESCCTIAWMALSVDMLRMTGDSVVADELELSTLNSGIGMMSPSGRWVTYNTPMEGCRKASAHDIVFQARAGQPELNCCSVNGPRALGMIGEWAVMSNGEGLVLNYYGPGRATVSLSSGNRVLVEQMTDYPGSGRILVRVSPRRGERFRLKLRIPHWSARTKVSLNGKSYAKPDPGRYLEIDRRWVRGDLVSLRLDMSLHFWKGEADFEGKCSIFRGPILLAFDPRFNEMDPEELPALDARRMKGRVSRKKGWLPPWMMWEYTANDGRKVRMCDFGSAGAAGNPYRTWMDVKGVSSTPFSVKNPLRSGRPSGIG